MHRGQVQRSESVQWLQQSFRVHLHRQIANVQHAQPPEALEGEVSTVAELFVVLLIVLIVLGGGLAKEDVGAAEEAEGHERLPEVAQRAKASGAQMVTAGQVELQQILEKEAYELQNSPNERVRTWNCTVI